MPIGIYKHKPLSEETKRKISESHKGKEKYWLKGKHRLEETKRKISESNKGKKHKPVLEETKKKISITLKKNLSWRGKPRSDETKLKISLKNKGKKLSEETKRKIILNHRRFQSEETKRKIKEKLIGHKVSEETKEKISKILKGKLSLNKNPAWLGGISFEPYDIRFNDEFKNIIRLRDNFCCFNCGISEQKHLILFGRKLSVHHINYNKKDTYLSNCITLCLKCNILANKNRGFWEKYYQDKLKDKYGYSYDKIKLKNFQIEKALGMKNLR